MPSLTDAQIYPTPAASAPASASVPASPTDVDDGTTWFWYLSAWGLFTRDRDRVLDHRDDSGVDVDDPIFFARTFAEALVYLPRCDWFETAFRPLPDDKPGYEPTKHLFWVTDGQPEIFETGEEAERAWIAQGDPWA
ncbi:hypothetical protein B0H12DRAFT_1078577 [Mycena haematopus]|nr:hypothetical protein B0H12DRAFT_1078577 [Mycena haematopus]